MGGEQFGRQVDNSALASNVEVDIQRNTANQFDDDLDSGDVSTSAYNSGEQNISGAKELVIAAKENSGNSSTIQVDWTDGNGNVIYSENPSALNGLSSNSDYARLTVKSTHVQVSETDEASTDYSVTVNAH